MGESIKFPTPKDTAEYTKVIRETLRERYGNQQVDVVVIAIPGIIKDGVAVWCKNLQWKNFDVRTALEGVLGDAPILVENDANLAGLGEARVLDPTPNTVLYLTISTGIGSGLITGGHIDPGMRYSEAGRIMLEHDGKLDEWENFASGRSIVETYNQFARDITDDRTWQQIAHRISRGFLVVIPIIQPEIIVIGGSVGTYFERYGHHLQDIVESSLPLNISCPQIIQAQHPEEAVIYGEYYYAVDFLNNQPT